MVILACCLIVMSVSGAETSTRQAMTDKVMALWDLLRAGFAQVIVAGEQAKAQAQPA